MNSTPIPSVSPVSKRTDPQGALQRGPGRVSSRDAKGELFSSAISTPQSRFAIHEYRETGTVVPLLFA